MNENKIKLNQLLDVNNKIENDINAYKLTLGSVNQNL